MKRWSLGILLVMAVVWIWAAKKDERAGAEPEEMIPVEHLVLPEEKKTEKKRIALTFDDDVIIGLSQEISYKEAVSMI